MKLDIRKFSLGIFLFVITTIYTLFSIYYFQQRETTAKVIFDGLQNDVSELSYVLSKHIQKEPIQTARALLDRKAANNDYIRAIAVFDDRKLLVTTDPSFSKPFTSQELHIYHDDSNYHILTEHPAVEEKIHYYQRSKFKEYNLVVFTDREFILKRMSEQKKEFFLLFTIIPLAVLMLLWLVISKVISRPMEKLRQYAYYQSEIPHPFMLKELEYIRASMVQTFDRLEEERAELFKLARTDSLSGIANRNMLEERAEQIIEYSKRHNKEFALLFLDLDNFKSINDSLGHDIGDELLKNIAGVIKDVLRLNDVVARIGGDEFIILLTDYQDDIELVEIIDRIQTRLMQPWHIQTFPINITSSIGIAVYSKDGENLLTLMKNADIAMYQAKENGRSRYHFFTEELNRKTQELISLTNDMKEALLKDEYMLYYQPQNDVSSGKIIGAEALIRWNHPEKGMISPALFIPTAEENGFIVELGRWILEQAFSQKQKWEEKGMDLKLSINIAAKQIRHETFLEELKELLKKYRVNTSNITFEITEYIFLDNSGDLHKIFSAIKRLGILISLDDFGTGYSSLSYLKNYPIDNIKIDKAFIDDCDSEEGSIFVETIIKMAQTLRLKVVAEGVETGEQLAYLKTMHCDYFQGYFCSQPLEIRAFELLYSQEPSSRCISEEYL